MEGMDLVCLRNQGKVCMTGMRWDGGCGAMALVGPVVAKNLAPDLLLASHRAGRGPRLFSEAFV